MLPVAILAHLVDIGGSFCKDSFVKGMFRFGILVACLALDWCDLLFVRHIVWVKSGVACNADKFLVGRVSQNLAVDEQRNGLAIALRGQGIIGVTGKAILLRLCNNKRCNRQER